MEEFQQTYCQFLYHLKRFIQALPDHYKEDVPGFLKYFGEVANIFPENHPDFLTANEDRVVVKVCAVKDVLTDLIGKIDVYINDDSKEWFSKKSRKITWRTGVLNSAVISLRLEEDSCPPLMILSGGISGVNTGVKYGVDPEVLAKLQELWKKLNE